MERVNKIISHPLWRESMEQIGKAEADRVFCMHDFTHLLDVARIAYIENTERGLSVSKELIYASALLHDIGRHRQYTQGIAHDKAGTDIAKMILPDCGFDENEQKQVLSAIACHRKDVFSGVLEDLIYRADKKSRNCMLCEARGECSWSEEKKNMNLEI